MLEIFSLIKQAQQLANAPCDRGAHIWVGNGGRGCVHPEDIGEGNCSQAVYECAACGAVDYGERGGPGHTDCMSCGFKHRASNQRFWQSQPTQTGKQATHQQRQDGGEGRCES